MFALVDCNNFYASCEALFRPDWRGRPIVVLSNNDGCVVARSAESKAMGIKMGIPLFKIPKPLREQLVICSSNYALYGDMSARVMQTLQELAPVTEVYSIDEAFLGLHGVPQEQLQPFGHQVRQRVQRDQGITVCVGVAPSKTLAKLANYAAKKWPATGGVVVLTDPRRAKLLPLLPVDEVWGVGRRLTKRLQAKGIHSAADLAAMSPRLARDSFSVVLERTVLELRGESCIPLEDAPPPKQQIVVSRSFGARITEPGPMLEAVATYAARAAEKLRQEGLQAGALNVFMHTSPFAPDEPHYSNSGSTRLLRPSSDSRDLVAAARGLAEVIWRDGFRFMKAGVMLLELTPSGQPQDDLFAPPPRDPRLMATVDRINRAGLGATFVAAQGRGSGKWKMQRGRLSPSYTTSWSGLPKAK